MDTSFQKKAARRLDLCSEMFELGSEMMRLKLRRDDPEATEVEIHARFTAWLHDRPGAEHGDGWGRPGTWPRSSR